MKNMKWFALIVVFLFAVVSCGLPGVAFAQDEDEEVAEEVLDEDDGSIYNLVFVFWGNLTRIDATKHYDFTTEIEQTIMKIFEAQGATAINYTEEDVFSNYTKYLEQDRQTLMRPNTGFRISFSIQGTLCE